MRRKKRVICEDFPMGDLDYEAIKRAFRELREERLERERQASSGGAPGTSFARGRRRGRSVSTIENRQPA